MKKLFLRLIPFLVLLISIPAFSQDIPPRPDPPRLVNDLAGILSADEVAQLEQQLVTFNDSTSTQITVVIVKSLNGYDKNDFAQRLGQAWGVGQKDKNNGIVVLVKPKTPEEKGEVSIQIGYGLEGVLPDITADRIVENEMIPRFRNNDYYGGISAGVGTIMSITKGEYSADQYNKKHKQSSKGGIIVPIIILIVVFLIIRSGRGKSHSVGKSVPFWTALLLMGSMGNSHRGSWGGFSGGSGGGGGGFGGFGGGSFGGGGAGGSW